MLKIKIKNDKPEEKVKIGDIIIVGGYRYLVINPRNNTYCDNICGNKKLSILNLDSFVIDAYDHTTLNELGVPANSKIYRNNKLIIGE